MAHSEARIDRDAQRYWSTPNGSSWWSNSHWRDSEVFANTDLWHQIGEQHLELFDRGARAAGFSVPCHRIVEWGCGGGANAVHFAPRARDEFIGVDVSRESADECGRQVTAACDTPYRSIVVDVTSPEAAIEEIGPGICDVFMCVYVFEALPTPESGARLLGVAHQLLTPGGAAFVQIKYNDGRWLSQPRRRGYRSGLAETTYPIHEFWELARRRGFIPALVELVPQNELDERYAYFFLVKDTSF
jgi:cyclopropane fatty-acyl-phospholipid synthase-like methyltransferase